MTSDKTTYSPQEGLPSRRLAIAAVVIGVSCVIGLSVTSRSLPMTWDEGNAILRSDQIIAWLESATGRSDEIPKPWSAEGMKAGWPFVSQIEGHPSLYATFITAGRLVVGDHMHPLAAARFGPICLFSLAVGALFYRMTRAYDLPTGLATVVILLSLPRLFAHVQTASFDGPLISCWILALVTFSPACRDQRFIPLWGLALGAVMSCKFTGWFAIIPFVVAGLCYRDRHVFRTLLYGGALALFFFIALNPSLWHAPIRGLGEFLAMNFRRDEFNISTYFLGQMYNRDHPLPWWNTLFWTGVTVPVGYLLLFLWGSGTAIRQWRIHPGGALLLASWAVLVVIRATPYAPPHDGVRLFVPAFASLAAVAGIGFGNLWRRITSWSQKLASSYQPRRYGTRAIARSALPTAVLLLLIGNATSVAWYAPHWLSYYNLLIGGPRGAAMAGMEPTYYWDGLSPDVLAFIHKNTTEDQSVYFSGPSRENLQLLTKWGDLRREYRTAANPNFRFYVLQHRQSGWVHPWDRQLVAAEEPAFRYYLGEGGWGPWRRDVPLVDVYTWESYGNAYRDLVRADKTPPVPNIPLPE